MPTSLCIELVDQYHTFLQHPGVDRTFTTILHHFFCLQMTNDIKHYVLSCEDFQRHKITVEKNMANLVLGLTHTTSLGTQYTLIFVALGMLHTLIPAQVSKKMIFFALTCIDRTTGYVELHQIRNKFSKYIAELFDDVWLCRYPIPMEVIYDNGTKFIGKEFEEILVSYGIDTIPTTVENPRANGIIEHVHLTMGDILRGRQFSGEHWFEDINRILQSLAWAIRSTVQKTSTTTPGQMAFIRDMVLNVPFLVDWYQIKE